MKKICSILAFVMIAALLGACSQQTMPTEKAQTTENISEESTSNPEDSDSNVASSLPTEEDTKEQTMKIAIEGTEYEVLLDDNKTVKDILTNMPLDLSMVRYAGHEYYAELPFTPVFDENRTSEIKAGHVYYWDGWNAFVINYVDYDIAPYKVVHIGEISDASISDFLTNAEEEISIQVTN